MKLVDGKDLFYDNEYTIMSEIIDNEKTTQRELSNRLGVSVSTVNILINKMIKEGLIKMTQVSQKQVIYMLTPIGMLEKSKKTVSYLKAHYRIFYETKEKIKVVLEELNKKYGAIFILIFDEEMKDIATIAVSEFKINYNRSVINIIDESNIKCIKNYEAPVLIHMVLNANDFEKCEEIDGLEFVNLMDRL